MKNERFSEDTFVADKREVTVYPSESFDCPIIYLNTFAEEGFRVYKVLRDAGCPDFTLVAVSGLIWNHDMSPWDIPPISKGDTPCTGGADEYLQLLIDEIIPKAERYVQGSIAWRGLAGYSLAGLFAVYSMYHTEYFPRIASMSGSLWFPGFKEYAVSHETKRKPECIYFSLGDKECRTRNPYLKTVQDNTEKLAAYYREQQINVEFRMNSGSHFHEAAERTAAGIAWLLSK